VNAAIGGRLKKAQWLGESVAVKHLIGGDDAEAEVELLTSVAHLNVSHAAHCPHRCICKCIASWSLSLLNELGIQCVCDAQLHLPLQNAYYCWS
jgi:hypothetical protein